MEIHYTSPNGIEIEGVIRKEVSIEGSSALNLWKPKSQSRIFDGERLFSKKNEVGLFFNF